MAGRETLLRAIPQVDELLRSPVLLSAADAEGHTVVRNAVRKELDVLRQAILSGEVMDIPSKPVLEQTIIKRIRSDTALSLRRVINATGIALHTNLGRARLAPEAVAAVSAIAGGYSNLEYDLATGTRGKRGVHAEPALCELCGCEAALVVNNNAAALLLALSTLAYGKEILISRGELVEIGDGFRVPDIMAQSGGCIVEVGTTNKTHTADYENAVNEHTGVLLKVHTSNFRVIGFTGDVSVKSLSEIGKQHHIPVLVDLGSGALLEAKEYPFADEPTVPQALRDGADIICFSGDKLLGGPQAGILLGKRELIERMRRNPLARALRIDKLSLAALEVTLRLYRDPVYAKQTVPVLQMLCADPVHLNEKAERLSACLTKFDIACAVRVIPLQRQTGGGAAPAQTLRSCGVELRPHTVTADMLDARLRVAPVPIIGRISDGAYLLDVSTIESCDFGLLAQEVGAAL